MKLLSIACFLYTGMLYAAPPPEFYLQHDWYAIELVLFEYLTEPTQRSLSEEDLRGRLPEELQAELTVLELPRRASIPSLEGVESELFNVELGAHPWFFKHEVVPLIERIKTNFETVPKVNNSVDPDKAPSMARDVYPSWLDPDWYQPSSSWTGIFRQLQLPESITQSLVFRLFNEPVEIESEEAEIELSLSEMIELEFRNYERELTQTQGEWHEDGFTLSSEAARIERSGWKLIHHGRFHATLNGGVEGESFFIQAGQTEPKGFFTYEMLLNISKRLYIHTDIQLWRTVSPTPDDINLANKFGLKLAPSVHTMFEKRRIVDDKPNYLDHPKFGMILKIEQLPIDQQLIELLEKFEEAAQPSS